MATPVELVPKATRQDETVRQSVIECAEELLADAKADKIKSIVLVVQEKDSGWHHRATHNFNLREEMGALMGIIMQRALQITEHLEDE